MATHEYANMMIVDTAASLPSVGFHGYYAHAKDTDTLYFWDGSAWTVFSGGGGGNSFETINCPSGTDPVADSSTDTLNLASGSAALTITGDSATDTVTFDVAPMVGDSGSGGTEGLAPAPSSGDAAAGKYLGADGTWSQPAAGSIGSTYVYKTSDEDIASNTTLQPDDDLTYSVSSGGVYFIDLFGYFSLDGNSGLKIQFNGSATMTAWNSQLELLSGNTTPVIARSNQTAFGSGGIAIAITAGTPFIRGTASFTVNAGGDVTVYWCQNSSNAAYTSMLAGSWMKITRIS